MPAPWFELVGHRCLLSPVLAILALAAGPLTKAQAPHALVLRVRNTYDHAYYELVEEGWMQNSFHRFGKPEGIPLMLIPHIVGTMDHWDPVVTDGFARDREVFFLQRRCGKLHR